MLQAITFLTATCWVKPCMLSSFQFPRCSRRYQVSGCCWSYPLLLFVIFLIFGGSYDPLFSGWIESGPSKLLLSAWQYPGKSLPRFSMDPNLKIIPNPHRNRFYGNRLFACDRFCPIIDLHVSEETFQKTETEHNTQSISFVGMERNTRSSHVFWPLGQRRLRSQPFFL